MSSRIPSDNKERIFVTMAIFRKEFARTASVRVAIEADSSKEADEIFKDWLEDNRNSEDFNDTLNEKEIHTDYWITPTSSCIEEYNRETYMDDFLITKPKKEPTYDLYFTFKGIPGMAKVFTGCTMDMVVEKLHKFNETYFLTRKYVDSDVNKIHYECEGR